MSHYFTNDFQSEETRQVKGFVSGQVLDLVAGPGIFSYKQFDPGTVLMLENAHIANGSTVLDLCCGY